MDLIKKIVHQASWQMAAKVASAGSTIVLLSIITRTFGESGTGVYTLAFTYLAFFYLAADLGLNGFYLGNYKDDPELPNKLFNFRLGWSFLLLVIAVSILPFLPFSTTQFIATVFVGGLTIVLNGVFNSTNFVFQHYLAYSKSSIASTLGSLTSLAVALVLVQMNLSIYYFALAPLAGWIVTALLCLILVKKFYQLNIEKPNLLFPVETLRAAWPVAATLVINTLYFRIDTFILSSTQSFADVGAYNLAYQIFQDILVVPTFIMNGYYPLMLQSLKQSPQLFKKQLLRAVGLMGLMGILSWIGVYLFSPFVIQTLTGGGFEGSVRSLNILAVSLPAFFLSAFFIWLMMARKLYKSMFLIYGIAFLVNFGCNWFYIPVFSYVAAAWVTVGSEYLILGLQVLILYRYRKDKKDDRW